MYSILQMRWLLYIESLYLWLCSFFRKEHLETMKWYVGESMILDDKKKFRDKNFFITWGFDSYFLIMDFLSMESPKDIQCRHFYIKDKSHFLNTK